MPATFPSHAGFVLPLKLWRPRWFDGVALVVGSALPDLPYVAGCCGPPQTYGHTWWGMLALTPFGLVLVWLVRWAAPTVAAHAPMAGPLALRDYGVLGVGHARWWVSILCVWLGALSHLLTDHVTHASIVGVPLGVPALDTEVVAGVPWWSVLHLLSSAIGAVAWLAVSVHIGRDRLLVRWHGPAPDVPPHPRRFWGTFAVVTFGCLAAFAVLTTDELPSLPHPVVVVNRAAAAVLLGLLAAAVSCRRVSGPVASARR